MQISVVMGSYNQADVLKRVLDGFNLQDTTCTFEVIVVDSGSTDGTHDLFKTFESTFQFKPIIQENNGKAAARNRGVKDSSSDIIIITDSDMIPHPGFIQAHYDAHQIVGDCCYEGAAYNLPNYNWPPDHDTLVPQIGRHESKSVKLGWWYFLTGNLSFPKSVFEQFNGFDESFKSYGWEDLELGYRLSLANVPLKYLPSAINYHYHVISKEDEITRCISKGESAKRFVAKHPKLKWFLGLNPISIFIFNQLKDDGSMVRFAKRCFDKSEGSLSHRFGYWFLKEYHYLSGVLKP